MLSVSAQAGTFGGNPSSGGMATATLADASNPVEMALAPEYTRLVMTRQRMTRMLKYLALSPTQDAGALQRAVYAGVAVQQYADEARTALDQAAKRKALDMEFLTFMQTARAALDRADAAYRAAKGE
jgi:hypothetical protein